jgi:HPt (histidine-containing phosphotransfer) domain-containing protein
LERIGQNWTFVDDLLSGFIQDNQRLVEQLEEALRSSQFEEVKEILHAIKGSAVSIGALSMRTTCQRFEKMAHSELKRNTKEMVILIRSTFDQLCEALKRYRTQRDQTTSHNH